MKIWMKFIFGVGAHAFIFVLVFFVVYLLPRLFSLIKNNSDILPPEFGTFVVFMMSSVILFFAVTGFFIIYLTKNRKFSSIFKTIWMLLFFFIGVLAVPVFFWLIICRHPSEKGVFSL